jgi:hypothetical protein
VPSKYEALSSNPSTALPPPKKSRRRKRYLYEMFMEGLEMVQMGEYLLSKLKVLSSNPSKHLLKNKLWSILVVKNTYE